MIKALHSLVALVLQPKSVSGSRDKEWGIRRAEKGQSGASKGRRKEKREQKCCQRPAAVAYIRVKLQVVRMRDKSLIEQKLSSAFATVFSAFTAVPADTVQRQQPVAGTVVSMKDLSARMDGLLKQQDTADVKFIFPNEPGAVPVAAHKVVLSSGSPVFRAMFFGPLAEKNTVEILDSESKAFRSMTHFVYTDKVDLTEDSVADVLYLAKKYDVEDLVTACLNFVRSHISRKNVVLFYHDLQFFGEADLLQRCFVEMDQYAHYLINNNEYLKDFSKELFRELLQRDTFCAREVDIFDAMKWWASRYINGQQGLDLETHVEPEKVRAVLEDLLPLVRFPLMTLKEFVQIAVPTKILTHEEVVDVLAAYVKDTKCACDRKSRFSTVSRCLNREMSIKPSQLGRSTGTDAVDGGEQRFERSATSAMRAIKFKVNQRIFLKRVDISNVPGRVCNESFQATIRVVDMDLNEVVGRADFVLKRDDNCPRGGRYDLEVGMIELCPKISYEILVTIEGPKSNPAAEHAKVHSKGTPEVTFTVEKFTRLFPEELKVTELTFIY